MTGSEKWKKAENRIPLSSRVAATGSSAASHVAQPVFKHMAWINIF